MNLSNMTRNIFKPHGIKTSLIFAVFLLFLSSALGVMEFNLLSGLRISINSQLINNSAIMFRRIVSLDVAMFSLLGVVLSFLLPRLNPLKASLLTIAAILSVYALGNLQPYFYTQLPYEYFLLMILILYAVNILISYFLEIHSKQKLLETFGQYIHPHIVEKISHGKAGVTLDGEARQLTVLFCDIQNFTRISEELNPKQVAHLLSEYFTALSKIIFNHDGTIDKFIGDSIMAFWGAPLVQEDHARRSVLAALDLKDEIIRLSNDFTRRGWPGTPAGIGINTGLMAVGNMGSVYRMAYTVIGDAVNIAARLETLTRTYHVPVIVSESTTQACPDILFRELDKVTLKGKRRQTKIHEPLCRRDKADDTLLMRVRTHTEGLECYYRGETDRARDIFTKLRNDAAGDNYYTVMLEKINQGIRPEDTRLEYKQARMGTLEETAEMRDEKPGTRKF